jgi:hypothetical protein
MRTPKFWTLVFFIDLWDWEDAEKTRIGWCRERFPNPNFPTLRLPLTGDAFVGGHETERDTPRMFPTTRRKRRAEEPSGGDNDERGQDDMVVGGGRETR